MVEDTEFGIGFACSTGLLKLDAELIVASLKPEKLDDAMDSGRGLLDAVMLRPGPELAMDDGSIELVPELMENSDGLSDKIEIGRDHCVPSDAGLRAAKLDAWAGDRFKDDIASIPRAERSLSDSIMRRMTPWDRSFRSR